MNLASLRVGVREGDVTLVFERPGDTPVSIEGGPKVAAAQAVIDDARRRGAGSEIASRLVDVLLPEPIQSALRRWASSKPGSATLAIFAGDAALDVIPWEEVPRGLGLHRVLVVRASGDRLSPATDGGARGASRVLVVGSPRHRGRVIPGVERELLGLPERFDTDAYRAEALIEPDELRLSRALTELRPTILHLALAHVDSLAPGLTVSSLCRVVEGFKKDLSLVVVNAGASAAAARAIAVAVGVPTIGWSGAPSDQEAADFSLFFHARLREKRNALEALRAYLARPGAPRTAAIPLVYTPTLPPPEAQRGYAPDGLLGGPEPVTRGAALSAPTRAPTATARLELTLPAAINPALLRNGKPALERLSIEASGPITDASLEITCDVGSSVSSYRETRSLLTGAQSVDTGRIHFPNLYELIARDARRRQVNFTVTLRGDGRLLAEETRSILWMANNEWLDQPETWAFIPAFVTPESDAVRSIALEASKLMPYSDAGRFLNGYQSGEASAQMKAFYSALQRQPFGIHYANPPGSPVHLPDSRGSSGQRVRSAKEIIDFKLGTCHDLSLLFASCAELAGLYPLVILVKGHTFFGFWTDPLAHADLWAATTDDRAAQLGDRWLIRDVALLQELHGRGVVELVEATDVTYVGNRSYEQAREAGAKRVSNLEPGDLDVAVDVWASRSHIQAT